MHVKWECANCHKENVINLNLESKIGRQERCNNADCGLWNDINFKIGVTTVARLLAVNEDAPKAERKNNIIEMRPQGLISSPTFGDIERDKIIKS